MEVEANIHVTNSESHDSHVLPPRTTEFIRSRDAPRLTFTKTIERFDVPETIRTLNSLSATSCGVFMESLIKSAIVYIGKATGGRRDGWCIGTMGARHMRWLQDQFGFTRSNMAAMLIDVRLMYLNDHFQPLSDEELIENAFCIAISEMAIHFDTFDDGTDSIDPICSYLNEHWDEMTLIWHWLTEFVRDHFKGVTKAYLHPSYRCVYRPSRTNECTKTILRCSPDLITVSDSYTVYDIKVCRHDDCLQYARQLDVYAQGCEQCVGQAVEKVILNLYLGERIQFYVH